MKNMLLRAVGAFLIFLLSTTTEPLFAQQQQNAPPTQNPTQPPIELPENPGQETPAPSQPNAQPPQNSTPTRPQPSGTAVAPAVEVSGSAASRPAGVAIAPPKQRQVRSWLIRFGFIAGAGAALGTVAALSAASPARVPNSPH
jgi:hypothetical protein